MTSSDVLYPATEDLEDSIREVLEAGGYGDEADDLVVTMKNYIGYVNVTRVANCRGSQDECFGGRSDYTPDDLGQTWRLWQYQVCTQ